LGEIVQAFLGAKISDVEDIIIVSGRAEMRILKMVIDVWFQLFRKARLTFAELINRTIEVFILVEL